MRKRSWRSEIVRIPTIMTVWPHDWALITHQWRFEYFSLPFQIILGRTRIHFVNCWKLKIFFYNHLFFDLLIKHVLLRDQIKWWLCAVSDARLISGGHTTIHTQSKKFLSIRELIEIHDIRIIIHHGLWLMMITTTITS